MFQYPTGYNNIGVNLIVFEMGCSDILMVVCAIRVQQHF